MQLNLTLEPHRPYAFALRPAQVVHGRPMVVRRGLWLSVRSSSGAVGLGDVAPWPGFAQAPTAPEALQPWLEELGSAWLDGVRQSSHLRATVPDAWDGTQAQVEQIIEHLQGLTAPLPGPLAGALQTAWLDLLGQLWQRPMAQLLGARPVTSVPVHALVDSAWAAGNAVAAGYSALKIKVGRRPISDELGTLCGIRSAVGQKVALRLDANGAWPEHIARQALRMFASVSPAWVEQPVAPGNLAGLRALKALAITPIAVDESITCADSLKQVIEHEAADGVVLKPSFVGGPLAAVRLGHMAQAAQLAVCVTHALDSQVGRAAALQVALALGATDACGLGGAVEGAPTAAPEVRQGRIWAPVGPGLGLSGLCAPSLVGPP